MKVLGRSPVLVLEGTDRARLMYVHLNIPAIVITAKLINVGACIVMHTMHEYVVDMVVIRPGHS